VSLSVSVSMFVSVSTRGSVSLYVSVSMSVSVSVSVSVLCLCLCLCLCRFWCMCRCLCVYLQVLGEHAQTSFASEFVKEAISSAWEKTHDILNQCKHSRLMLEKQDPALHRMVFGTAVAAGKVLVRGNRTGPAVAQESEENKVLKNVFF